MMKKPYLGIVLITVLAVLMFTLGVAVTSLYVMAHPVVKTSIVDRTVPCNNTHTISNYTKIYEHINYVDQSSGAFKELSTIIDYLRDSHEYVLGEYDCTQFNIALVKEAKKRGYTAYTVHGYHVDSKHDWSEVCITVDATPNMTKFPDSNQLYSYYKYEGRGIW